MPVADPLPHALPDAAAARALFASLEPSTVEQAMVAYLGPGARLLGVRRLAAGTADALIVPVRSIVAEALALDACGLVLAHTHPSGDPQPSAADLTMTRALAQTLAAVEVRLVDHLVLAGGQVASFRALGLL